ncbi:MAG: hypothetical protein NVS4B3_24510 [Gemmatimonadaceae bacterium]
MYEDRTDDYPWEHTDESWRGHDDDGSTVGEPDEATAAADARALREQAERDAALAELLGGAAIVDEPER